MMSAKTWASFSDLPSFLLVPFLGWYQDGSSSSKGNFGIWQLQRRQIVSSHDLLKMEENFPRSHFRLSEFCI